MPAASKRTVAMADSLAITVHYASVGKLIQTTISMLPISHILRTVHTNENLSARRCC